MTRLFGFGRILSLRRLVETSTIGAAGGADANCLEAELVSPPSNEGAASPPYDEGAASPPCDEGAASPPYK